MSSDSSLSSSSDDDGPPPPRDTPSSHSGLSDTDDDAVEQTSKQGSNEVAVAVPQRDNEALAELQQDDAELRSEQGSDDDATPESHHGEEKFAGPQRYDDSDAEEEAAPQPPIEYDLPLIRGKFMKGGPIITKWPNFLNVVCRPFSEETYDGEGQFSGVDEEGRPKLRLQAESLIRWRYVLDKDGKKILDAKGCPKIESNAKMVRWSDGSMTLHLGEEVCEVNEQQVEEQNQLFLRLRQGLHANALFKRRFTFRPMTTDSVTHRKMTMTMAEKTNRSQRVKLIANVGADPEADRASLIRKEEEKMRAAARREAQQRKQKERQYRSGLSSGFLEDNDDYEEDTDSVSAIKRQYKNRFEDITRRYEQDDEYDDSSRRIERAKIESDDEDERPSVPKKKEDKKRRIRISDDED